VHQSYFIYLIFYESCRATSFLVLSLSSIKVLANKKEEIFPLDSSIHLLRSYVRSVSRRYTIRHVPLGTENVCYFIDDTLADKLPFLRK